MSDEFSNETASFVSFAIYIFQLTITAFGHTVSVYPLVTSCPHDYRPLRHAVVTAVHGVVLTAKHILYFSFRPLRHAVVITVRRAVLPAGVLDVWHQRVERRLHPVPADRRRLGPPRRHGHHDALPHHGMSNPFS